MRPDQTYRDQPSLFSDAVRVIDNEGAVTRIARPTDPETSAEGERHIAPSLNILQARMLEAFQAPRTAREAARWCKDNYPNEPHEEESYRKRKDELRQAELIEKWSKRPCQISGRSAEVFKAVQS